MDVLILQLSNMHMDLGSTYDARFFNQGKALNYPASVTIGGETVPVNPVQNQLLQKLLILRQNMLMIS